MKIKELAISILPYRGTTFKTSMLRVSRIKLDQLTILVGPNGAGKTSVLEALGYSIAAALPASDAVLGMFLTSAFRPRFSPPAYIGGATVLDNDTIVYLYLDVEASYNERLLARLSRLLGTKGFTINLDDIKSYANMLQDALREVREGSDPLKAFKKSLTTVFRRAGDITVSLASVRRWSTSKHYVRALEALFSKRKRLKGMHVYLVAAHRRRGNRNESGVEQYVAVVFSKRAMLTIFTGERRKEKLPSVLALHPRLSFIPGVFESIYEKRALEGYLPGEKEAARILSGYIQGVEGFEVIKGRLSLKIGSRRLSIYRLSDGHRMASLLAFLYAVARPPLLLLIDTPEAFLYPDGVRIAAELIAKLAAENDVQVVVATQSAEILQEMLNAARETRVLDETLVHKLRIRENSVKAEATWPGRLGLYAIEGLEADLRR